MSAMKSLWEDGCLYCQEIPTQLRETDTHHIYAVCDSCALFDEEIANV